MKLKTFYEELGQDYGVVLNRMMGNEAFLSSLLCRFAAGTAMEELEAAVQSCEAAEIFHQAHTLKGVAENLGLKPLYERISDLVEITRRGETEGAEEAFAQVKQTYEEVTDMLTKAAAGQ